MTTTVYFVRHTEPYYTGDDRTRTLSPKGMRDRSLVTEFLADKNITVAVSSPFRRAYETIAEFAEKNGLTIQTVEDFRERRIADVWVEDFREFTRKQWEDFDFRLEDGECLREVQARNIAALKNLLKRYPGETIVVGTHGTALSTIIHSYDPTFGYDGFHRIRGKMPWVVRFEFEDGEFVRMREFDLFHP